MSTDKSKKKVVESKNIQQGNIKSGRDVQIGDIDNSKTSLITIIFFSGKLNLWFFLLLVPIAIAFLTYWNYSVNLAGYYPLNADDKGIEKDEPHVAVPKKDTPTEEKIKVFKPPPKKLQQPKSKLPKKDVHPLVITTDFSEVNPYLKGVLFDAYSQAFKRYKIPLIDHDDKLPSQLKLLCQLDYRINSIEMRGVVFEVEITLKSKLFDNENLRVLGTDSKRFSFSLKDSTKVKNVASDQFHSANLLQSLVPQEEIEFLLLEY